MQYNNEAVKKAVKIAVSEAKKVMFGKTRCSDLGGRKWKIEYSILFWREAGQQWGKAGWDQYHSSDTQKGIFWKTLPESLEKYQAEQLAVEVTVLCDGRTHSEKIFLLDGTIYESNRQKAAKLQSVKVAIGHRALEPDELSWMVSEIERLQNELRERDRAFIGHVYVPNDEYARICAERSDAIQRTIAAEKAVEVHEDAAKALVAVMGCLPTIYKKAGFIHIPTDKAIKQANLALADLDKLKGETQS